MLPRWLKPIRGMIGTGLAFAVGGSAIVALLGAAFLAYMAMGLKGAFTAWSLETAVANLILLTSMGAGAAAATLLAARKASTSLVAQEEPLSLGEGPATSIDRSPESRQVRHRE